MKKPKFPKVGTTPMMEEASTKGTLAHALYSDEWEYNFIDLVPCDHCGEKRSLTQDMVEVKRHSNGAPINLRFCGEHCANEYYLEKLRRYQ